MRGATALLSKLPETRRGFNPRAPCGARLNTLEMAKLYQKFQSTRPMRGATLAYKREVGVQVVSIHAPHAGRDITLIAQIKY